MGVLADTGVTVGGRGQKYHPAPSKAKRSSGIHINLVLEPFSPAVPVAIPKTGAVLVGEVDAFPSPPSSCEGDESVCPLG